ncbi:MAG: outer membrane lipoprotein carrier protein LolA [Proteobacteria bacterium]|nr:outer membrane lipoprotein carrier protein LolA [Pseudomonadota bacterium]
MRGLRHLALLGLILAVSAPTARAETPAVWGLGALMHTLAGVRAASGTFTETKTLALLKTPLHSSGTLRYVAPDYLNETVLTPARADFVLQNGVATLTANGQTHEFSLGQAPQVAGLVGGIRDTLAGDAPALRSAYTIALSGGPQDWQLVLRPKDPGVRTILNWLSIRGSGAHVTEIESGGAHGDLTQTTVHETLADAP